MWFPLQLTPDVVATRDVPAIQPRCAATSGGLHRRRCGATRLPTGDRSTSSSRPREARGLRSVVLQFEEAVLGEVRPSIEILGGAVLVLLLTAWTNVANLLLMRGAAVRGRSHCALPSARIGATCSDRSSSKPSSFRSAAPSSLCRSRRGRCGLLALAPPGIPRLETVQTRSLEPSRWSSVLRRPPWGWSDSAPRHGPPAARRPIGARDALPPADFHSWQHPFGAGCVSGRTRAAADGRCGGARGQSSATCTGPTWASRRIACTLVKVGLPAGCLRSHPTRHFAVFDELAGRVRRRTGRLRRHAGDLESVRGPGGWDANFVLEGQDAGTAAANPTLNLEAVAPGTSRH